MSNNEINNNINNNIILTLNSTKLTQNPMDAKLGAAV